MGLVLLCQGSQFEGTRLLTVWFIEWAVVPPSVHCLAPFVWEPVDTITWRRRKSRQGPGAQCLVAT